MTENTQLSNFESPKTFPLKRYYVCYLDILGVRDRLFKDIESLGFGSNVISPQREQKQKDIDEVSNQINGLFNSLEGLFKKIRDYAEVIYDGSAALLAQLGYESAKLLPSRNEFIRQAREIDFGIQQFSDSTLLYIPIKDGMEDMVDEVVASWMGELSGWILSGMRNGFMFRGAIAMGWGWEIRRNSLTGPVVHEAYKLESEVAKYPRIVFSQAVVDRLNYRMDRAKSCGVDMSKIPTFLKMVYQDVDSVYMLDYLSDLVRGQFVNTGVMTEDVWQQIYNIIFSKIGNAYLEFKNQGNSKLAERYWMLIRYMHEKKTTWENHSENGLNQSL